VPDCFRQPSKEKDIMRRSIYLKPDVEEFGACLCRLDASAA
jgi:hypothetical protein